MRIASLSAAVLVLSGCGDPKDLLFAEVEIPQLCQEMQDQQFEAAPVSVGFTLEKEFEYPLDLNLDLGDGFIGEAQLVHLMLAPGAGTSQLDFIDLARVELQPPAGSELPVVNIVNYDKSTDASDDGSVTLRGDKIDLLPYLNAGMLKLKAALSGTMPTQPWNANVQTCMYMRARYPYLNALEMMDNGGNQPVAP